MLKKPVFLFAMIVALFALGVIGFIKYSETHSADDRSQQISTEEQKFATEIPEVLQGLTIQPGTVEGSVDQINNVNLGSKNITINKTRKLVICGWIIDKQAGNVPPYVVVGLNSSDGDNYFITAKRVDRRDVVKFLNNSAYSNAGYIVSADIQNVEPGQYSLAIIQADSKIAISWDTSVKINIQ